MLEKGGFYGAVVAAIGITLMLRFLSWNAYGLIYIAVFAATGWILGRQREVDKGKRLGAIIGTAKSIIIAYMIYLPFDDFAPILVWLGSIYLGILPEKKINMGSGSGTGMEMVIGIVFDIVIGLFLFFGFSVK